MAIEAGVLTGQQRTALLDRAAQRDTLSKAVAATSWTDEEARRQLGTSALVEEILTDRLYAPYIARQAAEVARRRDSKLTFADDFDFTTVAGLSTEMTERLTAARPESLDQASRIPGVTPAALTALLVACQR
jgi:tRNA uridine 5-carboxymethylaminomethyl modification enzyme